MTHSDENRAAKSENEGEKVGIYGNLDDTRIAISSNEEIYDKVMKDSQPQGIGDIESMLEAA